MCCILHAKILAHDHPIEQRRLTATALRDAMVTAYHLPQTLIARDPGLVTREVRALCYDIPSGLTAMALSDGFRDSSPLLLGDGLPRWLSVLLRDGSP